MARCRAEREQWNRKVDLQLVFYHTTLSLHSVLSSRRPSRLSKNAPSLRPMWVAPCPPCLPDAPASSPWRPGPIGWQWTSGRWSRRPCGSWQRLAREEGESLLALVHRGSSGPRWTCITVTKQSKQRGETEREREAVGQHDDYVMSATLAGLLCHCYPLPGTHRCIRVWDLSDMFA